MKKLAMVIGLAVLTLLAVSAGAADPGRWDAPSVVLTPTSNITVDVSTNASVLAFAASDLRYGTWWQSTSGNSLWIQTSTNSLLGSNMGILITWTNDGSIFLPADRTGKGQLRARGNMTNTIPLRGVAVDLPR